MKSSEEMTENVIKRLNEHREKVSRRNAFIKKITFGLVNVEQQNALTEKFTDPEEVKGVGSMNRKFSLIATTSSVFLAMAVIISIISLNMRKPDFNDETETSQSLLISATNAENSTETSDKSDSVQIAPIKTTAAPATHAEKKVETVKTAKTTYLVKSTQTTAVGKTESNKADEPVQTEEPIQTTEVRKTDIPKTDKPIQTEEPMQTEKPVQTTICPVPDESIEIIPITISTDGVDDFLDILHEKYGDYNTKANYYNITPQEITDKYGLRVFKSDYDGRGTLYGESFLLYEDDVCELGGSFGGWGLSSMAIADTDHDGNRELYFTFSWGSGIHRSELGWFDMQSKEITYAGYSYWNYDMGLVNENGVLSLYQMYGSFACWYIGEEPLFGEKVGRIQFIDNEIQVISENPDFSEHLSY